MPQQNLDRDVLAHVNKIQGEIAGFQKTKQEFENMRAQLEKDRIFIEEQIGDQQRALDSELKQMEKDSQDQLKRDQKERQDKFEKEVRKLRDQLGQAERDLNDNRREKLKNDLAKLEQD